MRPNNDWSVEPFSESQAGQEGPKVQLPAFFDQDYIDSWAKKVNEAFPSTLREPKSTIFGSGLNPGMVLRQHVEIWRDITKRQLQQEAQEAADTELKTEHPEIWEAQQKQAELLKEVKQDKYRTKPDPLNFYQGSNIGLRLSMKAECSASFAFGDDFSDTDSNGCLNLPEGDINLGHLPLRDLVLALKSEIRAQLIDSDLSTENIYLHEKALIEGRPSPIDPYYLGGELAVEDSPKLIELLKQGDITRFPRYWSNLPLGMLDPEYVVGQELKNDDTWVGECAIWPNQVELTLGKEYHPEQALEGYKKLIDTDHVKLTGGMPEEPYFNLTDEEIIQAANDLGIKYDLNEKHFTWLEYQHPWTPTTEAEKGE